MKRFQSVLIVLTLGAFGHLWACTAADSSGADTKTEISEPAADATSPQVLADPCLNEGTAGATATCLTPKHSPEYYAEQASKYFDTLDISADPNSIPNYSIDVARWEWPPWLLLTGYGRQDMIDGSIALKDVDPSTVPVRDCRGFPTQPFARCYVVFEYEGGACPIYEEFTFNDAGEMTFIEAWSDLPGLLPQEGREDKWGERGSVNRLSTRVPGLGHGDGTLDLESSWMVEAAESDPDIAAFALRASDWWSHWLEEIAAAPKDFFAQGCGW